MANLWLNNVNNKMIHEATGAKGPFKNVSFACDKSENGLGTISVSVKQVKDATRKDGSKIDGYSSVLIGEPEQKRQVSIKTANGYEKVEMTIQDIYDAYEANRAAHSNTAAEA